MTLPQQEIDRIERCNDGNEIGACVAEASLWFKRMGEFAEMQASILIGKERYLFYEDSHLWVIPTEAFTKPLTTPELIELFINSLNEKA